MNIAFFVRPADGVTPSVESTALSVEAVYSRAVTAVEGERADPVLQTVRVSLDATMKGAALLENAASVQVQANVLGVDGSLILSRAVIADNAGNATLALTKAEVALCSDRRQAVPTDIAPLVCTRTVRLVPTSDANLDYTRSSVMVSPVKDEHAITDTSINALLVIVGNRISSLDVTGKPLEPLTRVAWLPTHLSVDGTFTCTFTQQPSIGWMWWLAGDTQVLGFVPDDLSKPSDRHLAIALPALSVRTGVTGLPAVRDGECGKGVPANVTEAELANNPGVFTEDPGAFCKPFSNPERVLSEMSFSVIARVTQPEIGPRGTTRTRSVKLLTLDGEERTAVRESPGDGIVARVRALVSPSREAALATVSMPTRYVLPSVYTNFVESLPSGRGLMDANHPLQWEDDIAQYQAATVALGHILEFRIRWRSNGYSLGTVAKTLTLAPRQVKRIQKIEWERSDRARRTERTQLTDIENDAVTRERDYQDQVSAHLSEWARGASHSDTEAIAGGFGFFLPGILGGVGGGAGSSNSSSHQEGGRDTSASEHQRLRDAIRRHGDALRKFESTVVNEVTQEETVTGTTEVIRNLNYAHSLTVIYYQILRHLKVNTAFAGARECLFVPFAIKAFDIQRAYRWREAIQSAIRSRRYLRALRYLKDVLTHFSTSDIPPGTRAEQPLTYLRGSIFVNLAIERPKDAPDGKYDDDRWIPFKQLFGTPSLGIFAELAERVEAERDRVFQANFAPAIAAKWADRLQMRVGRNALNIDCTLATRYQFNRGVRIDFVVPTEKLAGLTRSDLQNLVVVPSDALPPGSVANLTRMSLTYSTARFERSIQGRTGVNDLIRPESGHREEAAVSLPLDAWESVNERLEISRSVQDLVEHLNEHVEYYHKAIWWRMDRDRLMMMLDGFYVPNTNNVSLATVVDREPIGIIGNCLVYKVGAASFIGYGTIKTPADLYNLYAEKQAVRDPVLVSLPTDGLYAQTIMDECLALEEHFGNLDWALNDKDPELGTIDPSLLGSRRADQTAATTPTPFPATIINLQNAPEAPAPSGLQGVLNAVTNPNAFRDMAGLAATQASAQAALSTAAGLATNFGNQAAALELAKMAKSQEATRTADQKLATIQRAKEKGLADDAEAAAQTKEVLSSMNPDTPKGVAPHENAAINSAITAAQSVPGSSIEANTGEGAVKVTMGGGDKEDSSTQPLIIEVNVTGALRAFEPGKNFSGKTKLSVRGKNLPSGSQLRWSIPPSEAGKYAITQRVTGSGISEVEISGIQPGMSEIDVEALDAGVVIASSKYPLSIPQFITVDDSNLSFDAFITANLFQAVQSGILDEARTVIERLLLSEANVRLLWASKGGVVPAHVPITLVTRASILNTDPSGAGDYAITAPGPASGGNVGDTVFDEVISLFPASYLATPAGNTNVDLATNQLVQAIMSIQSSDPEFEAWLIRIFGRLLGETMSHEIYHALLPVPFVHNVDGSGALVNTGDLMDAGMHRSFLERTGITAPLASVPPAQLLDDLVDNGIGTINTLTGASLTHIRGHFPVPPTAPFNA